MVNIHPYRPLAFLNRMVTGLILILICSGIGFSWYSWHEEKKDQINNLCNIMEMGEKGIDSYFSEIEKNLNLLAFDLIEKDGQVDLDNAFNQVQRLLKYHPDQVNISFIRADGQILFTGKSPPASDLPSLAQEPSFQQYRDELQQERPLCIGQPLLGLITKVWIVPFRYGIWDQNGRLLYIISANLPVEMLQNFWKMAPFVKSSALGLMRDDGFLVSRYPVPSHLEMQDIYGKPRTGALIRFLKREGFPKYGYVEGPSSLDGPNYLNSFRRLEHFPITMFVAMPMSVIWAGWLGKIWAPFVLSVLLLIGSFVAYRLIFKLELERDKDRNLATAALIESKNRFDQLALQSGTIVWEADTQGLFTYASHISEPVLGYRPDELVGTMCIPELYGTAECKEVKKLALEMLRQNKSFTDFENPILAKGGRQLWGSLNAIPVFDEDGTLKGYKGTLTDITIRKKSDNALRESEFRFRNLFEQNVAVMLIIDPETGSIMDANAAAVSYYGWSLQKLKTMRIHEINTLPADEVDEQMKNTMISGALRHEFKHLRADGSIMDIEVFSSRIRIGEKDQLYSIIHDISDRKIAENVLKEHTRLMQTIMDSTPDFLVLKDCNGIFREANAAYCRFLGKRREEIVGKTNEDIFPPEEAETYSLEDHAVIQTGDRKSVERIVSGENKRWLNVTKTPFLDSTGNCTGVLCSMSDISIRKQLEAEKALQEIQDLRLMKAESLNRMAGAIAHKFNNILQVVIGYLEMTLNDLPQDSGAMSNLTESLTAARKAADISGLMLTYQGQSFCNKLSVNLSEVIHNSIPMLRSISPSHVSLEDNLPDTVFMISADAKQIQQIVINLVTNAWEAAGKRNAIIQLNLKTVSCMDIPEERFPADWKPNDSMYACLEVADTAGGIPPENFANLFDPFFSSKFTGRGLGLPVVLGIARAHSGGVTVENNPGTGCIFSVYFPLFENERLSPPEDSLQTAIPEGCTVLLIDDEFQIRNLAKIYLSRLGYSVMEAKDGVEAVEIFQQHQDRISFVLSDLTMPRLNGWDTLAALRKLSPNIPVILSSGYDEAQIVAVEHVERPNAFLKKPYRLKDLREVIDCLQQKNNW